MRHLLLTLLLLLAPAAQAVITATADGTGNTTAPADDPGWANVGTCGCCTAVYLGKGWVATANHVGTCNPTFHGTTYTYDGVSAFQAVNPQTSIAGVTQGTLADLLFFKLTTWPEKTDAALHLLHISPGPAPMGATLTMIGDGLSRGVQSWVTVSGQCSRASPLPLSCNSYTAVAPTTMRWGTAQVSTAQTPVTGAAGFITFFSADPNSAEGVTGDSGGGVFYKNGGKWYLTGIMVNVYHSQGASSATQGTDYTYMVDLFYYAPQVVFQYDFP